jgi:uncharacterized protein (TIGR03000 family)
MRRKVIPLVGLSVFIASALLLGADRARAWSAGERKPTYPLPSDPYFYPGYYGYDLNDRHPGYYGGGRYREYYNFGGPIGYGFYPVPYRKDRYDTFEKMPWAAPCSGADAAPLAGSEARPAAAGQLPPLDQPATIVVRVPADAEVWLDDAPTKQTGASRAFASPPLTVGEKYVYEVRARWTSDGRPVEQTRRVVVTAGGRSVVNFAAENSAD